MCAVGSFCAASEVNVVPHSAIERKALHQRHLAAGIESLADYAKRSSDLSSWNCRCIPHTRYLTLALKFHDVHLARVAADGSLRLAGVTADELDTLKSFFAQHDLMVQRYHTLSAARLAELEAQAMRFTGQQQPDWEGLIALYQDDPTNPTPWLFERSTLTAIADVLRDLPGVECVLFEPVGSVAGSRAYPGDTFNDVPPGTTNHATAGPIDQPHLGLTGLDLGRLPTDLPRGDQVTIAAIEHYTPQWPDAFEDRVVFQEGALPYIAGNNIHGLGTIGIILGDGQQQSFRGIAPQSRILAIPESGQVVHPIAGSRVQSRTASLVYSAGSLQFGDVVMLQMQTPLVSPRRLVPAETQPGVWLATRFLTDMGLIVVSAAGNGGEPLEYKAYSHWRSQGDSGAILVGASTVDGNRWRRSTFGERIDVHAWGEAVQTFGPNTQRPRPFGGTSGATAQITGLVSVLQAQARAKGYAMSPHEMRSLLWRTGRFSNELSLEIGPFPIIHQAAENLADYLALVPPSARSSSTSLLLRSATLQPHDYTRRQRAAFARSFWHTRDIYPKLTPFLRESIHPR